MNTQDLLFNEESAGSYLGGEDSPIPNKTLQRWRFEGTGPRFVKLGRLVRYPKSELDAFLAAGLRSSTSTSNTAS